MGRTRRSDATPAPALAPAPAGAGSAGKVHVLEIPDWCPTTQNRWSGRHWAVRRKYKELDRRTIAAFCYLQDIPRATGPRRVDLAVTMAPPKRDPAGRLLPGTSNVLPDPDNLFKSLLDGLKRAGRLLDDRGRLCVLGTPTVVEGPRTRTVVRLTDLDA